MALHRRKQRQQELREQRREQRRQRKAADSPPPPSGGSFPNAPPPMTDEEMDGGANIDNSGQLAPPEQRVLGNEFQEKDIVRLLVEYGGEWYDKEEELNVATFILSNI